MLQPTGELDRTQVTLISRFGLPIAISTEGSPDLSTGYADTIT